jgi:hypothetical protein
MFLRNCYNTVPDKTVVKTLSKCAICVLILYFFPIAIYPIIFWISWLIFNYETKLKNIQSHMNTSKKETDNAAE